MSGLEAILVGRLDRLRRAGRLANASVAVRGHGIDARATVGFADAEGRRPMTPETPIFLASVTKLFTAVVTLQAEERGELSLADRLVDHLPDELLAGLHVWKGEERTGELRLWHLLSQTSGLADYFEQRPSGGRSLFSRLLEEGDLGWTPQEAVRIAAEQLRPVAPPAPFGGRDGEARAAAHYSDTNFQLIGLAIESATGATLAQLLRTRILDPLGMKRSWLFGHERPPRELEAEPARIFHRRRSLEIDRAMASFWADGGLVSTLPDALRFVEALFAGELFTQSSTLERMLRWRSLFFPFDYGLGMMRLALPRWMTGLRSLPPLLGHAGASGSFLFHCPAEGLSFAGTLDQTASRSLPVRFLIGALDAARRRAGRGHGARTARRGVRGKREP